jgi:hypothetical protein
MSNADHTVPKGPKYELAGFFDKCRTALFKCDTWNHIRAIPTDMIPSEIIKGLDADDLHVIEHVLERESRIVAAKKLEAINA